MKNKLDLKDFRVIIKNINQTLQDNARYLSKLDSLVGDGDHGTTIARGFKNAVNKIEEEGPESISSLLKMTGFTLISTMGGAAGPLFGSIFTEMARVSGEKEKISLQDLHLMFSEALNKISGLGGARPGDKTMVDSLHPAVESLEDSISKDIDLKEALKKSSLAAKEGAESTIDMIAAKGRARYVGERSRGHQDAGATTLYLMIKAIYESV